MLYVKYLVVVLKALIKILKSLYRKEHIFYFTMVCYNPRKLSRQKYRVQTVEFSF